MSKIIAVCGATGGMGGAVTQRMLKDPAWQVRAVTRDPESEKAKALLKQGAEVVSASYDDVDAMVRAFNGATAIFAVTNFWVHVPSHGTEGASRRETQEMLNIASAASQIPSLEHFVLHSLPAGEKVAGKGYFVPHTDSKDRATDEIMQNMPDLARKTTFLWVGMFSQNMWTRPFLKPIEVPAAQDKYAWLLPISANTAVPFAGDAYYNVGVYVHAILGHPEVSLPAKYAFVTTETITMPQALEAWSKVTGKPAVFANVSLEGFTQFYGPAGHEVGLQYRMHDKEPDMAKAYRPNVISAEDLGIRREELIGHEEALEKSKDQLL